MEANRSDFSRNLSRVSANLGERYLVLPDLGIVRAVNSITNPIKLPPDKKNTVLLTTQERIRNSQNRTGEVIRMTHQDV